MRDEIPLVVCNTIATTEHVSNADRSIRTIKEQMRGIIGTLLFECISRCLKMEFIYFLVIQINAFTVKDGVLVVYLPRELLVRWRLD
jgi:hypothetical protein